jgi:hypothetical protein
MGLHSGTVDQDLLRRPSGLRKRVEQIDPDAFCRPADIAVVEGFPWPVFWRSVDPATARPQHIDDPADHPTIVNPRLASRVRRQMRLNPRKLLVRQPEMVPIHQRSLSEAVNHKPDIMPTTLWVRTLGVGASACAYIWIPRISILKVRAAADPREAIARATDVVVNKLGGSSLGSTATVETKSQSMEPQKLTRSVHTLKEHDYSELTVNYYEDKPRRHAMFGGYHGHPKYCHAYHHPKKPDPISLP